MTTGAGPSPNGGVDRTVVALLVSVFCSMAAVAALVTSLGKQVYDLTGRELDLGLLGLAEFAPAALLVLVTGAVADRHERRLVGAAGAAGEAVVAAALAVYAADRPTAVLPIFALVLVFGVCRAFHTPASRALVGDVVPPERVPWLVARSSFAWQSALVAGPVLGGFLYTVEVWAPYVAAAVLFVLSAVALLIVHPLWAPRRPEAERSATPVMEAGAGPVLGAVEAPPAPPRARLRDAVEGVRFIRRTPVLLGAIALDLFAVLFGGAVALLPAIATDRLGVDAVGLGWLRAAGGIGAGAVALTLSFRPLRRRVGTTLLTVVACFGAFTILLGLTRSFPVAFLAMVVLSGADAVSVFIRATLVPLVTPEDKRGRVMAVESVFIGASNELGAFESGVAGQILGPSGAIVLGGVATLTIAGAWWVLFPDLRDVDQFPAAGLE